MKRFTKAFDTAWSTSGWLIYSVIVVMYFSGHGTYDDFLSLWLMAHGLTGVFMTIVVGGPGLLLTALVVERWTLWRSHRKPGNSERSGGMNHVRAKTKTEHRSSGSTHSPMDVE